MDPADSQNSSFPTEDSRTRRYTDVVESSLESVFNGLSLSQNSQIHVGTSSSQGLPDALFDVEETEAVLPLLAGQRPWDSLRAIQILNTTVNGNGYINVSSEALYNTDMRRYLMASHEPGPSNGAIMANHQRMDFFGGGSGGAGVSGTSGNHEMLYNNLHAMNPVARGANGDVLRRPNLLHRERLDTISQHISFESLRGRIAIFAQDEFYSGVLMNKMDEGLNVSEIQMIVCEVLGSLNDLLKNQFGCQFMEKLFFACNEDQRTMIVLTLTEEPFKLIQICLNCSGSRTIQRMLGCLTTPMQIWRMTSVFAHAAVVLANDPNASLVIQYCIKNFNPKYNMGIFILMAQNCFEVATNRSGCIVLQDCVEYSFGHATQQLVHEIVSYAMNLAENAYGNYVVQLLIELNIRGAHEALLMKFRGRFIGLSRNKYASNVVQTFLKSSCEEIRLEITNELVFSPEFTCLLTDPFANYVVQTALTVSKGHTYQRMLDLIKANRSSMEMNMYGTKILRWLQRKPDKATAQTSYSYPLRIQRLRK